MTVMGTQSKFTFDALSRIGSLVSNTQKPLPYKLIALVDEVATIDAHHVSSQKQTDLFSQLSSDDLIKHCFDEFANLLIKEPFLLTQAVDFNDKPTSLLNHAYMLKKTNGKKNPLCTQFFDLIKEKFPEEVAEDAYNEKEIAYREKEEKEELKQKIQAYESGRLPTTAYAIYMLQGYSATRRYALLMKNAEEAFQKHPIDDKDIKKHSYQNPELHVSLHFMKTTQMLRPISQKEHDNGNVVDPSEPLFFSSQSIKQTTLLKLAEEITQRSPEIGEIFTNYLTGQQGRLNLKQTRPDKFIYKGKNL